MKKNIILKNAKRPFKWLNNNKEIISNWITIIGLPFLVIGGVVAYFQLSDYMVRADLELQFTYGNRFRYFIVNDTSRTAEEPYLGFVVTDLNLPAPNILPIPFEIKTFIKPGQRQSPEANILDELDEPGHKYKGTVMITCKNCDSTRRYFLYIDNEEPEKGFYVPFKNNDDYKDIIDKTNKAKSVDVIPLDRRVNFDK